MIASNFVKVLLFTVMLHHSSLRKNAFKKKVLPIRSATDQCREKRLLRGHQLNASDIPRIFFLPCIINVVRFRLY